MKREIINIEDMTPEQKGKMEKLQHELAVSEIKTANGIDDIDNLAKMIALMTSDITPEEAEKIRNDDHYIERWKYGLSSPKHPDLKHDADKLREFAEKLRQTGELSEEVFDQFDVSIFAISDDAEYLADDKDAYISGEYGFEPIPEFLEIYTSENLQERIDIYCNMCVMFADIVNENLSANHIYSKIVGHAMRLITETDALYMRWHENLKESAK